MFLFCGRRSVFVSTDQYRSYAFVYIYTATHCIYCTITMVYVCHEIIRNWQLTVHTSETVHGTVKQLKTYEHNIYATFIYMTQIMAGKQCVKRCEI